MNKKDRNKRHRRRSSNSSSSSIERKRDDMKRQELKKNEKEVERKKEQAGRLMALAHSGSGASNEETGRWKQEPQENLKEFRSTKGSTWGGKGREEKTDSYMGNRRTQREEIGERGANEVWGKSPTRDEEDSDLYSEPENMDIDEGKEGKKEKKSKKSKKSKKETGKSAVEEVESKSDEESEEESPKQSLSNRANRVGHQNIAKRTLYKSSDLNSILSNMSEDDKEEWGGGLFKALRAKSARATDNPTVHGTMWSKRNGGRSTGVAAVMDSGCTHPITTMTVTKAMGMKVTPLTWRS